MREKKNSIESEYAVEQDELSAKDIASKGDSPDRIYTFEAMKLKVNDRLQIQPPAHLAQERAVVRLIGYVNNLCLFVTAPRQPDGLRMQLNEGDELVVRIFSSQNAFGFSSAITKIIKLPFEYLHLSFPTEVKGMLVRKAPRVKTRIICSISTGQAGEENLTGILTNISANGALLASRRSIANTNTSIKLAFRLMLHGHETLLSLNAVVRSQFSDETPANPTPANHGLEFIDLTPHEIMLLQSMVYQQMIEQPDMVM